jgi:hypothetical protein
MAGLAVTPMPKHSIRPGLRILGQKDNLPTLPEVEYVLQTSETDTRQMVAAFSGYCLKQRGSELGEWKSPRANNREMPGEG